MSNYILNIDKLYSVSTPQIVGRVADLPKSPIDVQVLDGDKPLDLTSATVEFRGVTPTDKKIISTSGITVTNKVTGSFTFTFPKNFYTSTGRFKRAYFVIKRGERLDSTQDLIIHVIESIDFDLDESGDIIEGLDQVIKEVTDKMNKETQAMIDAIQKEYDNLEKLLNQQAQNNIAKIDKEIKIAIDESKLRMRQLESEYRGVINNAQSTLNQLNKEMDKIKPYVDETNKVIDKMDSRLKELEKKINDNDLVKRPEFLELKNDFENLNLGTVNYFQYYRTEPSFEINGNELSHNGTWSAPIMSNEQLRYSNLTPGERYRIKYQFRLDEDPSGYTPVDSRNYGKLVLHSGINFNKYPSIELADDSIGVEDVKTWKKGTIIERETTFTLPNDISSYTAYRIISYTFRGFDSDGNHKNLKGTFMNVKLQKANLEEDWVPALNDLAYRVQVSDLQKQIDELKKIVTALGGS